MHRVTSIPEIRNDSLAAMDEWFGRMADRGLLFHPDDSPASIEHVDSGLPLFTTAECRELEATLDRLFECHGNAVHDACLRHAQRVLGIPPG